MMDADRLTQLYTVLNLRETQDLLDIWQGANINEWEDEVFEIVHQILLERLGTLPPRVTQAEVREALNTIDSLAQALEFDKALSECQKLIETAPSVAMAYYYRGLIHTDIGQLANAEADFWEALRLDPKMEDARYNLDRVEKDLEAEFENSLAKQHIDQALEYIYTNEPDKVLEEIELAGSTMPPMATAYNYLGNQYSGLEQWQPAEDAYLEAIRLNPRLWAARENLAHARVRLEEESYRPILDENDADELAETEFNLDLDEYLELEPDGEAKWAPGWIYMDEKAFLLAGWPGHRTRPGRSGYDPLELDFEAAHMLGVAIRLAFTGKFRFTNPAYLFLLTWIGLIYCLPLLLAGIAFIQGDRFSIGVLILYAPYWIPGTALMVNIYLSVKDSDEDSELDIAI